MSNHQDFQESLEQKIERELKSDLFWNAKATGALGFAALILIAIVAIIFPYVWGLAALIAVPALLATVIALYSAYLLAALFFLALTWNNKPSSPAQAAAT